MSSPLNSSPASGDEEGGDDVGEDDEIGREERAAPQCGRTVVAVVAAGGEVRRQQQLETGEGGGMEEIEIELRFRTICNKIKENKINI